MMDRETQASNTQRVPKREQISELRRDVDARDETIRLLNEALSRALDELNGDGRAAA